MPVYLHPATLIIERSAIQKRYKGGLTQFKKDFLFQNPIIHQEDLQVCAIGSLNIDEFDMDKLIERGLHFDLNSKTSTDFWLKQRYSNEEWSVNWICHNKVFAWHIKASDQVVEKAKRISGLTSDQIEIMRATGVEPFGVID